MDGGEDLALQDRPEVDQHVAATDQIHAAEGGFFADIVLGEDAEVAHLLVDAVAARIAGEIALQEIGWDINGDGFREPAGACLGQGPVTDVAGEDLDRRARHHVLGLLEQVDGE